MTYSAAIRRRYQKQAEQQQAERARKLAEPDNALVDDPFRPGFRCRQWEATVHPSVRGFRRIERSMTEAQGERA